MSATLKDIAAAAGVSIRTVTRFLKNEPHISKDRYNRIKLAIEKLGYTPNLLAQSLKNKRKNLLGIILPSLSIPVLTKKLVALQHHADRAGFRTMVGMTEGDSGREERFAAEFAQFCDGLLFLTNPGPDITGRLQEKRTPFILVDRAGSTLPSVAIDRGAGIAEALRQLHGSYYAYLFVSPDQNPQEPRRCAFDTTVKALGLTDRSSHIATTRDAFEGGYTAGERVAAADRALVVCYSDRIATGLLKRLNELNVKVPGHFGVTGFDDDEYPAWLPRPLSTISQNVDDLAARSLSLMQELLDTGNAPSPAPVPTRFIRRETTI